MNLIIDRNLRELRAKRGNTQEELADYLSVSIQAVSKWERSETMPDISLLPQIAAFYDVSVDDLLGVGEIRKREIIDAYKQEYETLMHAGYSKKAVELMRRAHHEFPHDLNIMYLLSHSLQAAQPSAEEEQEVISLCDRILSKSTDSDLRALTIQNKCMAYSGLGDKENGRKCAMSAQGVWQSVNSMLPMFLEDKELIDYSCSNILEFTDLIETQIMRLAICEHNQSRRIKLLETILKLNDVIFDDGNYGHFSYGVFRAHTWIAKVYARLNNETAVRQHLELAEKYAAESMKAEAENKSVLTSTIFNGYEHDLSEQHKPSPATDFEQILLAVEDKVFNSYRNEKWFTELKKRLEAAKQSYTTA